MFKKNSVGQRIQISRHKQIVIAAIAVSAMLLYAVPAQQQFVSATLVVIPIPDEEIEQEPEFGDQDLAQRLVDDTRQRIDQDAEQRQTQEQEQEIEQELEQENEADIDQSEENNQANVIETGDNTATATQIGDNDAIGNEMAAESEGGSGEASASIEQAVDNEFSAEQDSSANDNVLVNENTFGDDIAVVDQDNVADQTAVNVGIQEQDQDINQYAANVDLTAQLGEQVQTATIGTLTPPPEPEETFVVCVVFGMEQGTTRELTQEQIEELEEQGFNVAPGPCPPPEDGGGNAVYCFTYSAQGVPQNPICGETLQECQEFSQGGYLVISECQRYEEPPPNANCIRPGGTVSPC